MFEFLNITKALAEENRLRILIALENQDLCVCQLIELLKLAPSTVSKHVSILRQARLIGSVRIHHVHLMVTILIRLEHDIRRSYRDPHRRSVRQRTRIRCTIQEAVHSRIPQRRRIRERAILAQRQRTVRHIGHQSRGQCIPIRTPVVPQHARCQHSIRG